MGVPEADVRMLRMVEGTYEGTKGRVMCAWEIFLGIQGGRRPKTGECAKPTVVHRSNGCDQQESEYEGRPPQVDVCR